LHGGCAAFIWASSVTNCKRNIIFRCIFFDRIITFTESMYASTFLDFITQVFWFLLLHSSSKSKLIHYYISLSILQNMVSDKLLIGLGSIWVLKHTGSKFTSLTSARDAGVYNLDLSVSLQNSPCDPCMVHCCLHWCTICQEHREMQGRLSDNVVMSMTIINAPSQQEMNANESTIVSQEEHAEIQIS
jgi:Cys-rich protein (TIGR01571 family)